MIQVIRNTWFSIGLGALIGTGLMLLGNPLVDWATEAREAEYDRKNPAVTGIMSIRSRDAESVVVDVEVTRLPRSPYCTFVKTTFYGIALGGRKQPLRNERLDVPATDASYPEGATIKSVSRVWFLPDTTSIERWATYDCGPGRTSIIKVATVVL